MPETRPRLGPTTRRDASSDASIVTSVRTTFETQTFTSTTGFFLGLPAYTVITTTIPTEQTIESTVVPSSTSDAASSTPVSSSRVNTAQSTGTRPNAQSTTAGGVAGQISGTNAGANAGHHHSSGISGGAIAAAVIVPIVVIAALILGVIFCLRKRKQRRVSQASTAYHHDDEPHQEMAMAGTSTNGKPSYDDGPPTLNHIVPGELAKETEEPAAVRAKRFSTTSAVAAAATRKMKRGSSLYARKPVPKTSHRTSAPQIGADVLGPVSPIDESDPETNPSSNQTRDPFRTPDSTLRNTPEDAPNFLSSPNNAYASPPRTGQTINNNTRNELFTDAPETLPAPVGRHWHTSSERSRFNGKDPRKVYDGPYRPHSPGGESYETAGEESEGDAEDVEIGEATAAHAHRQRASVIDMIQLSGGGGREV